LNWGLNITKPFNFSEVLARIRAVLRNRELFGQIVSRESRLTLAEELEVDMKNNLADFIKSIDELDEAINHVSRTEEAIDEKTLPRILEIIKEKTARVRRSVAELDARIERTVTEWENLKQHEIGLHILEQQIRKSPHQE